VSKYTTLVFDTSTKEGMELARKAALSEHCRAWSMDHEIIRNDLIEKALEENDLKKAYSYIGEVDVHKKVGELEQK
jgi:hypothetical protein